MRYDNQGPFASLSRDQSSQQLYQQGGNGVALTVPVTIPKTMNPPVGVPPRTVHSTQQRPITTGLLEDPGRAVSASANKQGDFPYI